MKPCTVISIHLQSYCYTHLNMCQIAIVMCSISETTPNCIGFSGGHPFNCSKKLAINRNEEFQCLGYAISKM